MTIDSNEAGFSGVGGNMEGETIPPTIDDLRDTAFTATMRYAHYPLRINSLRMAASFNTHSDILTGTLQELFEQDGPKTDQAITAIKLVIDEDVTRRRQFNYIVGLNHFTTDQDVSERYATAMTDWLRSESNHNFVDLLMRSYSQGLKSDLQILSALHTQRLFGRFIRKAELVGFCATGTVVLSGFGVLAGKKFLVKD